MVRKRICWRLLLFFYSHKDFKILRRRVWFNYNSFFFRIFFGGLTPNTITKVINSGQALTAGNITGYSLKTRMAILFIPTLTPNIMGRLLEILPPGRELLKQER